MINNIMEELKKILFEMEYINSIYNDVKKTYNELEDKQYIYNAYNNEDLKLLLKIVKLSHFIMNYIYCFGDNSISSYYFNNIILTKYNKTNDTEINYMYYDALLNNNAYERNLLYCYKIINEYIHNIENI